MEPVVLLIQSMMFAQKFNVQCGAQIFQGKYVMTNSINGPFFSIPQILRGANTSTAIKKQSINAQNVRFISVLQVIVVSERSME